MVLNLCLLFSPSMGILGITSENPGTENIFSGESGKTAYEAVREVYFISSLLFCDY